MPIFFSLSPRREWKPYKNTRGVYCKTLEVYTVKTLEVYIVTTLEVYIVTTLEVYTVTTLEVYTVTTLEVYTVKALEVSKLFTGGDKTYNPQTYNPQHMSSCKYTVLKCKGLN